MLGIGHRLPTDLTSDDVYAPDPVCDLAATDASFEESRQIREAAMKAHAEVSIRDRIEDSVRARPRTQTVLRADDVIMVWQNKPAIETWPMGWARSMIGTHRGSVWVNMRGSLWKCSQLQCKLATTEESRGLEIQNQLLDDTKAEFQEFPGRRVYTDVDSKESRHWMLTVHHQRPRTVQEEEDRTSALVHILPPVTSPSPSLPELDSESHRSFRARVCLFRQTFPAIWRVIAVIKPRLKTPEIRVGPCRQMSCHVKWEKMCKMCEHSSLSTQWTTRN